jgi:hypothetical protein
MTPSITHAPMQHNALTKLERVRPASGSADIMSLSFLNLRRDYAVVPRLLEFGIGIAFQKVGMLFFFAQLAHKLLVIL